MENISKSTEDLISQMKHNQPQMDDLSEYPLRELLGLDKQLRSIRGLRWQKRFGWKKASRKKSASSRNYKTILEFTTMSSEKTS